MTYCISDIHGEYDLFMRLLEKIKFSSNDRLIVCGDFIDKGTASIRLAKAIFKLPNVYCIMGNHEYMFLKFYRSKMHSSILNFDDMLWHLQEYFPVENTLLDWNTVDMLVDLPYYFEEKDFICVHAGVPLDNSGRILPLAEGLPEEFVYDRQFKSPEILPKESKCVLFGHTPTTSITPNPKILAYPKIGHYLNKQNIANYFKIHLDTGVSMSGVLGCFCVDTCRAFYVTK
ncbi:MAG: serine/threonine protein phosphatase [Clostridia bacterium]|nr:serine/threonine protein phosphatase [Clostridia bacterium]